MEYLHRAARHISDHGRGPDDALMHVSHRELAALGHLVPGGKLPTNPYTGLPEAGLFESLLPAIVGIVATVASGGAAAPVLGGLMSGGTLGSLATAATSTAMTGDLGKGIASGLMSYGMGSAMDSLAQPAANAATSATTTAPAFGDIFAGTPATTGVAGAGGVGGIGGAGGAGLGAPGMGGLDAAGGATNFQGLLGNPSAATLGSPGTFGTTAFDAVPAGGSLGTGASIVPPQGSSAPFMDLGGGVAPSTPPAPMAPTDPGVYANAPSTSSYNPSFETNASTAPPDLSMGERFNQGMTSTGDRFDAAMANLKSDPGGTLNRTFVENAKNTTLPIAIGAASAMQPKPYEPPKEKTSEELQRMYPEQFPTKDETRYTPPPPGYDPAVDGEWDYFPGMSAGGGVHGYYAKGGIADANPAAATRANILAEAKMALLDHHPKAKQALRRYADTFGEDALKKLTDSLSSMGGRIRGAGGGLDDLIPGTIEGRKEVRLADGEFVVPADVVSHLGDGSSDHGVRKLTEMMDRIRKEKTGTTKQASHIKDHKVLPA